MTATISRGHGHPKTLGRRELGGLALASSLVPLNSTMIAVALSDLAGDFDIGVGSAGILVTVYLLVMLVGQPTAGRLIDVIGANRALRWSLVGFVAVSIATAFANEFYLLLIGRALQAAFGAALIPSSQSLLRSLAEPSQRGRSFGLLASFTGAGAAGGPVIGGLVIELGGWRGIFLVNVPIAAVALFCIATLPGPVSTKSPRAAGSHGVMRALAQRTFGAAFATQATSTMAQYSLLLIVPIVLDGRGWSATQVGGALTALTAGMVLMGPVGGRFGDVHGRRRPAVIGVGVAAAAALLAALTVENSSLAVVVAITVFGFGLGFAIPSIQTAALESVPETFAGSGSGVLSMSRHTGSIPASILLAVLVSDGGDGAAVLLGIATVAMFVALAATTFLPGHSQPAHSVE